MSKVPPPVWSDTEFKVASEKATGVFRDQRLKEPLDQYVDNFDLYRGVVEEVLEATVDLTEVESEIGTLLTEKVSLEALRYLVGPPISEDDLKTVAEASLAPSILKRDPDMADRVARTIFVALDRRRFPWVHEGRSPSEKERESAALATAALLATQKSSTGRRSDGKNLQEAAVETALIEGGLTKVETRRISAYEDAPGNGEFCGESHFGERKADFVIGLRDGRKMPLECKASNSSTNSVKRLNNDAAAKATAWNKEFGAGQTVPAAMLSGVFKVHNLRSAQSEGLTIFWEHELNSFVDWINSTLPS